MARLYRTAVATVSQPASLPIQSGNSQICLRINTHTHTHTYICTYLLNINRAVSRKGFYQAAVAQTALSLSSGIKGPYCSGIVTPGGYLLWLHATYIYIHVCMFTCTGKYSSVNWDMKNLYECRSACYFAFKYWICMYVVIIIVGFYYFVFLQAIFALSFSFLILVFRIMLHMA